MYQKYYCLLNNENCYLKVGTKQSLWLDYMCLKLAQCFWMLRIWDWYNNFSLIVISWKFLGKAQNNSFNFQQTIPGSLWSIKLCDTRRCPSSTQSYTAVPLTLNQVKAWLTGRQIQGLQRVWERDRETNPGAPAGLRERQRDKSMGSSGFEREGERESFFAKNKNYFFGGKL